MFGNVAGEDLFGTLVWKPSLEHRIVSLVCKFDLVNVVLNFVLEVWCGHLNWEFAFDNI